MLKFIVFLALTFSLPSNISAQIKQPIEFEQLKSLQEKEKKLVMVFIQTDWCKYCNAMKQTIIKNKQVSAMLDTRFYTVFLNAEERQDIVFAGRQFKYKPTGINTGVHQLAEQLGTINGQIAYPSICFLNEKNEIIYQSEGFLNPQAFVEVLDVVSKTNL